MLHNFCELVRVCVTECRWSAAAVFALGVMGNDIPRERLSYARALQKRFGDSYANLLQLIDGLRRRDVTATECTHYFDEEGLRISDPLFMTCACDIIGDVHSVFGLI